MSTHNICFYGELEKIIQELSSNTPPYQVLCVLYKYSKRPKISYTEVSDKMAYANSIDPDQTAPEGAV